MKAVIQRVSSSSVRVDEKIVGSIGPGLNILLGVQKGDKKAAADKLVKKIPNLRIFADERGKMNRSLIDRGGEALVISQFTLAASVKKGRRPGFDASADAHTAKELYEYFVKELSKVVKVQTGEFGAMMEVDIVNDGPVTFVIDSNELKATSNNPVRS
ncbi:MAG: D-aminoacyl-tRNA deacylase [Campylobacterota bacterium]